MPLINLPNELLMKISRHVLPDDLENFAWTNRLIRSLAESALVEHARLKAEFSEVVITPSEVSIVLGTVCVKPYLNALYIKKVTLTSWPQRPIDHADADLVSRTIRAIANRTGFLPAERVDEWIREILVGNAGAANAFILASLPNIENLQMSGSATDYRRIQIMVRAIVDAQRDPKHPQALTRLSKLTIAYAHTGNLQSLRKFLPFLELPSMRTLSTTELNIDFFSSLLLKPRSSELSTLELHRAAYTVEGIISLLRYPKALRKFQYSQYRGASFGARFICGELQKNAADTLEEMVLSKNGTHGFIGSLQGFKRLKVISTSCDAFRNYGGKMPRLVDVLPPSTKTIELEGRIRDAEEIDLFTSFSSLKASYLPNLTHVRVMDTSGLNNVVDVEREEFLFWYSRLQHGLLGHTCINRRGEWRFLGKRATGSAEGVEYWLPEVCEFPEDWQDLWKSITGSRATRVKPDGDLLNLGFIRYGCGQAHMKMP